MRSKETKKRRDWETEKNIRNVIKRLNGFGLQMNSSILFLKAAAMKMKTMLFSTLDTVRQTISINCSNLVA